MDHDPLAAIAGELYDLPPEQFVPARDEAVKGARAAGDRALATAIGKLRRPTVGAWAVNRLARHRPELVDELLAIGEQMRAAQRDLRGDELRELSARRRFAVDALYRAAVVLAGRDNLPVNEIEATLMAALADPETADQVRAGQLARTVEYTGFGETPRPQLRLVHGGPEAAKLEQAERESARRDQAERDAARRGRAEQDATRREQAEQEAERRLAEQTETAERRAAERAATAEVQRARAAAHRELLAARTELSAAEAARTSAERAVKAAKRRVERAIAMLKDPESDDRA